MSKRRPGKPYKGKKRSHNKDAIRRRAHFDSGFQPHIPVNMPAKIDMFASKKKKPKEETPTEEKKDYEVQPPSSWGQENVSGNLIMDEEEDKMFADYADMGDSEDEEQQQQSQNQPKPKDEKPTTMVLPRPKDETKKKNMLNEDLPQRRKRNDPIDDGVETYKYDDRRTARRGEDRRGVRRRNGPKEPKYGYYDRNRAPRDGGKRRDGQGFERYSGPNKRYGDRRRSERDGDMQFQKYQKPSRGDRSERREYRGDRDRGGRDREPVVDESERRRRDNEERDRMMASIGDNAYTSKRKKKRREREAVRRPRTEERPPPSKITKEGGRRSTSPPPDRPPPEREGPERRPSQERQPKRGGSRDRDRDPRDRNHSGRRSRGHPDDLDPDRRYRAGASDRPITRSLFGSASAGPKDEGKYEPRRKSSSDRNRDRDRDRDRGRDRGDRDRDRDKYSRPKRKDRDRRERKDGGVPSREESISPASTKKKSKKNTEKEPKSKNSTSRSKDRKKEKTVQSYFDEEGKHHRDILPEKKTKRNVGSSESKRKDEEESRKEKKEEKEKKKKKKKVANYTEGIKLSDSNLSSLGEEKSNEEKSQVLRVPVDVSKIYKVIRSDEKRVTLEIFDIEKNPVPPGKEKYDFPLLVLHPHLTKRESEEKKEKGLMNPQEVGGGNLQIIKPIVPVPNAPSSKTKLPIAPSNLIQNFSPPTNLGGPRNAVGTGFTPPLAGPNRGPLDGPMRRMGPQQQMFQGAGGAPPGGAPSGNPFNRPFIPNQPIFGGGMGGPGPQNLNLHGIGKTDGGDGMYQNRPGSGPGRGVYQNPNMKFGPNFGGGGGGGGGPPFNNRRFPNDNPGMRIPNDGRGRMGQPNQGFFREVPNRLENRKMDVRGPPGGFGGGSGSLYSRPPGNFRPDGYNPNLGGGPSFGNRGRSGPPRGGMRSHRGGRGRGRYGNMNFRNQSLRQKMPFFEEVPPSGPGNMNLGGGMNRGLNNDFNNLLPRNMPRGGGGGGRFNTFIPGGGGGGPPGGFGGPKPPLGGPKNLRMGLKPVVKDNKPDNNANRNIPPNNKPVVPPKEVGPPSVVPVVPNENQPPKLVTQQPPLPSSTTPQEVNPGPDPSSGKGASNDQLDKTKVVYRGHN